MQIAMVHAKYLSRLEDMFYQSQLNDRMKAQTGQNIPQQNPQQQQQPQMSNQFLEAVARGGNGMLNEQQKKALEGRKQNQAQGQFNLGNQRQTPQGTDIGVLQAMKQNPKMAVFWVKSKEEAMRQKLRKSSSKYAQIMTDKQWILPKPRNLGLSQTRSRRKQWQICKVYHNSLRTLRTRCQRCSWSLSNEPPTRRSMLRPMTMRICC
jgi:hypothetical protein